MADIGNISGVVTVRGVAQGGATVLIYDESTYAFVDSTTTNPSLGVGLKC